MICGKRRNWGDDMDETCILMGIDSSTKATGISVYANGVLKEFELLTEDNNDSKKRLENMIRRIYETISKYKPDIIAIETPTVCRNQQTQRQLTMIFGAIYGFCVDNNIFFKAYRPSEWRKHWRDDVMPRKRAELKKWAIDKVKDEFEVDVSDDVAEAILIGGAYVKEFS